MYGDPEGDLLIIGWGSTLGSIEEAVDRVREQGHKVSSVHLRILCPFEPGLKEIFKRFKKVVTIEINYSDSEEMERAGIEKRYSQLAFLLRAHTLVDIDCWSRVPGIPFSPGVIENEILKRLNVAEESP